LPIRRSRRSRRRHSGLGWFIVDSSRLGFARGAATALEVLRWGWTLLEVVFLSWPLSVLHISCALSYLCQLDPWWLAQVMPLLLHHFCVLYLSASSHFLVLASDKEMSLDMKARPEDWLKHCIEGILRDYSFDFVKQIHVITWLYSDDYFSLFNENITIICSLLLNHPRKTCHRSCD
jgi:hypothetical protein